jgi:hypothetical protein
MATTVPERATPSREDRSTSILVRFTAAPNVTTEPHPPSGEVGRLAAGRT